VKLTPAGRDTQAELRSITKRFEKEFLNPLDAEEREMLHALLRRLAAHHDERFAEHKPG